ncbi:LysR family transcriptional regulator [Photobacterium sp. DNB22_13_2]
MNDEDMFRLDFNCLKVLKIIGEESSTHKAAERLKVGQSAVSKTLKRLREQFNDPLFTRKLHGLEPTPKCELLLTRLPHVLSEIEELFRDNHTFEPDQFDGVIKIHINASLCHPLTSILIEKFHQLAPKATLQFEDWSYNTEQQIKIGQIDLGINFYPINVSQEIFQKPLCYPKFKLCCAKDNPIALKDRITLDDIANSPLVLAIMPGYNNKENYIETYLKRRGYIPNVLLRTDKLEVCSKVIKMTNSLCPVSEIVSPIMEEEGLILIDVDHLDDVEHYPIAYFINNRVKDSAYSEWLIQIVTEVINDLTLMYKNPQHQYTYPRLTPEYYKSGQS